MKESDDASLSVIYSSPSVLLLFCSSVRYVPDGVVRRHMSGVRRVPLRFCS